MIFFSQGVIGIRLFLLGDTRCQMPAMKLHFVHAGCQMRWWRRCSLTITRLQVLKAFGGLHTICVLDNLSWGISNKIMSYLRKGYRSLSLATGKRMGDLSILRWPQMTNQETAWRLFLKRNPNGRSAISKASK